MKPLQHKRFRISVQTLNTDDFQNAADIFRTRVIFKEQLTCKKEDSVNLTLKKLMHDDPDDYADKIRYAKHLAASPDAAGLPGFVGRSR